jgi:hypothetical protein
VNALRLLRALHVSFQKNAGRYFPDRAVERVEPRGGGFRLHGTDGADVIAASKTGSPVSARRHSHLICDIRR